VSVEKAMPLSVGDRVMRLRFSVPRSGRLAFFNAHEKVFPVLRLIRDRWPYTPYI
jgi:hypothetical protein